MKYLILISLGLLVGCDFNFDAARESCQEKEFCTLKDNHTCVCGNNTEHKLSINCSNAGDTIVFVLYPNQSYSYKEKSCQFAIDDKWVGQNMRGKKI